VNSPVSEMELFWTSVLRLLNVSLKQALDLPDWELPPGTKHCLATYEGLKDGKTWKSFQYLSVCMKRASRYWTKLWEDIAGEAAEYVESSDDHLISLFTHEPPLTPPVGADEQYVMLIVGLEARLYRWIRGSVDQDVENDWEQTSASKHSVNLHPGESFSPLQEPSRKMISEFLETVKLHCREGKAKRRAQNTQQKRDK